MNDTAMMDVLERLGDFEGDPPISDSGRGLSYVTYLTVDPLTSSLTRKGRGSVGLDASQEGVDFPRLWRCHTADPVPPAPFDPSCIFARRTHRARCAPSSTRCGGTVSPLRYFPPAPAICWPCDRRSRPGVPGFLGNASSAPTGIRTPSRILSAR